MAVLALAKAFSESSIHSQEYTFIVREDMKSVHAERARSGRTEWVAIMLFYQHLIRISPTLGTRTGYAAAVAEAKGPEAGLGVLDGIGLDAVSGYQPTGRFVLTYCNG
jgi:predicted RNA polymerase sigma factor